MCTLNNEEQRPIGIKKYKNLYDITIKPNMVVFAYNEDDRFYGVTFLKSDKGIVAVESKGHNFETCLIYENDSVGRYFDRNYWKLDDIFLIKDYDSVEENCVIYKQVEMTLREIEEQLGLGRGTLRIKRYIKEQTMTKKDKIFAIGWLEAKTETITTYIING